MPARVDLVHWPFWGAALAVASATLGLVLLRQRWPALLATWLAYLVILAPHVGLARIGTQIAADRYCYMASIPLSQFYAAWGFAWIVRETPRNRPIARAVTAMGATSGLLLVLKLRSRGSNALTWRNSAAALDPRPRSERTSMGVALTFTFTWRPRLLEAGKTHEG